MIIERLAGLIKRGIESPSIPLTGSNIGQILGNEQLSQTGLSVTRDSALALAPLKAGVEMIAADIAKTPIFVYRNLANGNREPLRGHPASQLLRRMANPFITSHVLIQTLVGHAILHRGGYARIFRNGSGRPTAVDLLDPEATYPVVADDELFYQTLLGGRDVLLPANEVFHLKGLGFDGLDGWSLIDKLREMLGLGLASQQHAAVYFANNAQPSFVIKFPGYLKEERAIQRFRASWGEQHAGVNRSSKPAILEGGAEIQPFSVSHTDSQFLENRQLDIRMIATALKIPPHKLGDDSRTSFASLEQENQRYADEGLDPWWRAFEVEAMRKLLSNDEYVSESVFIEFTRSAMVRTDLKARFEAYGVGIQNGFMSRAQIRRLENWNVEDENLEEFLQPLNMVPAGQEPEPQPAPEPAEEPDERLEALTRHMLGRLMTRLKADFTRKTKTLSGLIDWAESLEASHGSVFVRDLTAVCGQDLAEQIVFTWFSSVREELRDVSSNRQAASKVFLELIETAPEAITERALSCPNDGEALPQSSESSKQTAGA